MEKVSRERFIRLGSALGVGAAVASLAACGGGATGGDQGGGGSEDSRAGGEAQGGGGAAIAKESAVAPGSAVAFKNGGQDAVLVHLESGDFVAYSAVCTHQACTVAYQNGKLACPCHGSAFDPANGA